MHRLILIIALLLCFGANAQTKQPYGNAERARTSSQRTDTDLHTPRVRLGYLDTTVATNQEFLDNLEVGLRGTGFPDNKIISFTIMVVRRGVDVSPTSAPIPGSEIPPEIFKRYMLDQLRQGDKVFFENIKVEYSRNSFRTMSPIVITIQ